MQVRYQAAPRPDVLRITNKLRCIKGLSVLVQGVTLSRETMNINDSLLFPIADFAKHFRVLQ